MNTEHDHMRITDKQQSRKLVLNKETIKNLETYNSPQNVDEPWPTCCTCTLGCPSDLPE